MKARLARTLSAAQISYSDCKYYTQITLMTQISPVTNMYYTFQMNQSGHEFILPSTPDTSNLKPHQMSVTRSFIATNI